MKPNKNTMRHIATVFLLTLGIALAQNTDALLAVVGKNVITFYDLQQATAYQEAMLAREYKGRELEKQVLELRRQVLNALIDKELVFLEFTELKATVPTAYLQDRMNTIVAARANGNYQQFEEMLAKEGHTIQEFRSRLSKELAVELLIREKVGRGNQVSEEEVQKFYESRKEELKLPTRYHVAVIQIGLHGKYVGKVRETLREIVAQLQEGVSFEDLARKYSEGASAQKGGDQVWMTSPAPKLLEVLSRLKPGQVETVPVELGQSAYLVKLIAKEEGGIPPLTNELKQNLRQFLEKIEEKKRYDAYIRTLYIKYPVRRMDQ